MEEEKTLFFDESENHLFYDFVLKQGERVVASGKIILSDEELLALYETTPELAMQDVRMESLLNPPEPSEPEPTQLDRIETNINTLVSNDSVLDVLLGVSE